MKKLYKTILFLAAIIPIAACSNNHLKPDFSPGYRLTFDGGVGVKNQTRAHWSDLQGSGNLIFKCDYTPEGEDGN